jgi:hypothetical protein
VDPSRAANNASNVAILLVYGAVIVGFLWRFHNTGRAPTLVMAALPVGWVLASLWDMGLMRPMPFGVFRWMGVALGIFILFTLRPPKRLRC